MPCQFETIVILPGIFARFPFLTCGNLLENNEIMAIVEKMKIITGLKSARLCTLNLV